MKNNVCYSNITNNIIKTNTKFLKNYKIDFLNDNATLKDKLMYIYKHGGLYISGKFEIVSSSIDILLKTSEAFFSYDFENNISESIIYSKMPKNDFIKKVIDNYDELVLENSNISLGEVLNNLGYNTSSKINHTIEIEKGIYIYSCEYFYPLAISRYNDIFSENIVAINHFKKLHIIEQTRIKILKQYGSSALKYLLSLKNNTRTKFAMKKYAYMRKNGHVDISYKQQIESISNATKIITDEYKNKEYIVLHNPRWLGVTSASKELFDNLVPLEEISKLKDAKKLASVIVEANVKQVILSAFADGWDMLAIEIKSLNPDVKIKCFYHGSHSQVIELINWKLNTEVINLHKKGIIDVFATCKKSLVNFYKAQGYKVAFLDNTVKFEKHNFITNNKDNNTNNDLVKIGIYAAGIDWRKNMYTQVAATSLIKNSVVQTVSISKELKEFTSKENIKIDGSKSRVSREELLEKMSSNDINLYVTFSECAPMLPLESLEVGTLCITGDNHHYFKGTELEKYLVVSREDDIIEISNKIKYALENRDKILQLYRDWKIKHDKESKKSIDKFLKM